MEVILMERIEKLGQLGEQVTVKAGFARNFLLPTGKAIRATESNRKQFETKLAQIEVQNLKQRGEAEAVAKKMDQISITLIRQAGENGQLYGSVTNRDAAEALTDSGFSVDRSQFRLEKPIKTLGLHKVMISLHPEVLVSITANVARSTEEAKTQKTSGKAIISVAKEEAPTEIIDAEGAANDAVLEQAGDIFEEGVEINITENSEEKNAALEVNTEVSGNVSKKT